MRKRKPWVSYEIEEIDMEVSHSLYYRFPRKIEKQTVISSSKNGGMMRYDNGKLENFRTKF